jgi:hypothetical protein
MLRGDPYNLARFKTFYDEQFLPKMSNFIAKAPLHVHALDVEKFGVEGDYKDRILLELEKNGLSNRTENHVKVSEFLH